MFLWIHFQVPTIWDPKMITNDDDIRKIILNLPAGLNKTYSGYLKGIKDLQRLDMTVKVFRWLYHARGLLTTHQAREVASIDKFNVERNESQILITCVTDYCGNLVTTDATNSYVQFTHPSVKQFLYKLPPDGPMQNLQFEELLTEACFCIYQKANLAQTSCSALSNQSTRKFDGPVLCNSFRTTQNCSL